MSEDVQNKPDWSDPVLQRALEWAETFQADTGSFLETIKASSLGEPRSAAVLLSAIIVATSEGNYKLEEILPPEIYAAAEILSKVINNVDTSETADIVFMSGNRIAVKAALVAFTVAAYSGAARQNLAEMDAAGARVEVRNILSKTLELNEKMVEHRVWENLLAPEEIRAYAKELNEFLSANPAAPLKKAVEKSMEDILTELPSGRSPSVALQEDIGAVEVIRFKKKLPGKNGAFRLK
jgi:hypothetical protein